MFSKVISILVAALLLAGCAGAPATATNTPEVVVLAVQHSPALRDLAPRFFACAQQQDNFGILVDERPVTAFQPSAGASLRWGPPAQIDGYAASIGEERLAVAVHPSSPLSELTGAQLQSIYTGQVTTWAAFLQPACESCPPDSTPALADQPIQALAYSSGEDIQTIFESSLGVVIERRNSAYVADPEAMRAEIAGNPAAIGFLPARYVDDSIKELELSDLPAEAMRQPILAVLPAEPQGAARAWLACLQATSD